jgi:RND family efflux transporter MFP subunit
LGAGAIVLLSLAGCVDRGAQAQAKKTAERANDPVHPVVTTPLATGLIQQTQEITGEITTSEDSTVGPKNSGKIVAVFVNDGDHVTAGQLLATQDTSTLIAQQNVAMANLSQARAAVLSAQSGLEQAIENLKIGPSKSTSAVLQAQAGVRSAQAALDKLLNGARPEERRQADATLASAKSNMETQKKELDRIKTLVDQGALAGTKLDAQQATYDAAKATYDSAYESVRLMQIGNRQEDIDAARDAVRSAQETLATARANKRLDPILQQQVDAARATLDSARAQVTGAQAQLAVATQAIADAQIKAPFDGRVSGKPVQPGTVLAAGGTVARIIGKSGIYFDGQVPSDAIATVALGAPVSISVDAYPGKLYTGKIAAINPLGSEYGRQFSARVEILGDVANLKPGMFARGEVVVKSIPNATIVPLAAVVSKTDGKVLFTVTDGKAHALPITQGIIKGDQVQVIGVPAGTPIVVKGQTSLIEGTPVRIDSGSTTAANKSDSVGG